MKCTSCCPIKVNRGLGKLFQMNLRTPIRARHFEARVRRGGGSAFPRGTPRFRRTPLVSGVALQEVRVDGKF